MITEGEAAILLETTLRAFGNQSQSKQRSTLVVNSRDFITGVAWVCRMGRKHISKMLSTKFAKLVLNEH